jgi:hypothetical protein
MIRADYCGRGTPHTRDGTLLDLCDKVGINRGEQGRGGLRPPRADKRNLFA